MQLVGHTPIGFKTMKKTLQRFILACSLAAVFQAPAHGQIQQIQLLNGKTIPIETYQIGPDFITYKKPGDNGRRTRSIDRYDVFSVTNSSGSEDVVYAPVDSLDFSIDEAKRFILGEQAAYAYFKAHGASVSSAVIGAGSGLLQFYGLPVPMLYSVISGRFSPLQTTGRPKEMTDNQSMKKESRILRKMRLPDSYDPALSKNPEFRMGYDKAARNIKIQHSLKWGYIGLGTSLATLLIIFAH
ncbi:MAG: hypothetical protein RLZZ630_42 [Bacteroidota bacterium]|jgi:hypothetical protein